MHACARGFESVRRRTLSMRMHLKRYACLPRDAVRVHYCTCRVHAFACVGRAPPRRRIRAWRSRGRAIGRGR
eukprot:4586894-Pleurochrysis_carterae.AAC.1